MTLFTVIFSVWFISEIVLNRLVHSGKTDKKGEDKGSLRVIWITIFLAILSGILINLWFVKPISTSPYIGYAGLIILILGMLFRFYSIWSLGKMFTVDVTIRHNHKLKKDGVYKLIRHPSYSGMLVTFLGFGISFNNWISLAVIIIPVCIAMLLRIKVEENLLTEQFGEEYQEYKEKSYRLIPWIY